MGEESLAVRLGVPVPQARQLLKLHKATYPTYWRWSEEVGRRARKDGKLTAAMGWTLNVGTDANPRSVKNFPLQANGAEMLRLACILLTEAGVRVCAPVHDALLVEAPAEKIDEVVAMCRLAMAKASEVVLDGFLLRTESKVVRYPDRYMDDRGGAMWDLVFGQLGGDGRPCVGGATPVQRGVTSVTQMSPIICIPGGGPGVVEESSVRGMGVVGFEEECLAWKELRVPQVGVRAVERERVGKSSGAPAGGEFLAGPVPLSWLRLACLLPGQQVLVVSLALWFLAGLRDRRHGLELTMDTLRRFGLEDRMAKSRGLEALEQAGLIVVERRPGRDSLVSLLADQAFSGEAGQEWVVGEFLSGPIPLSWLGRVARLSGQKVLAVALALWFLVGLSDSTFDLKLTSAVLARFGVARSAKWRALRTMEAAGLIRIGSRKGKNPLVAIVEMDAGTAAA